MKAQKHSQSTTFSETHSATTTIENNEASTKITNTVNATYESDIASDDYKEVFSIVEKKLGKPSKNKKGVITWKNEKEAKDQYVVYLKENAILIDYSGTKEQSKNRKNILKLIENIEKALK